MTYDKVVRARDVIGDRAPADPVRRIAVAQHLGPARRLHLGDYLGIIRVLRRQAADPTIELTLRMSGDREQARQVAAMLVACGLGSASFELDDRPTPLLDLAGAAPVASTVERRADRPVEIFNLRRPRVAMGSPDIADERGIVYLDDTPLRVSAAVRGASVDLDPTLDYDPQLRPGVANLAVILGALTDRSPASALIGLRGASALKAAVVIALEDHLRPLRRRRADLVADQSMMDRLVVDRR